MPSARATALTRQHRAEIGRVAAITSRQVEAVARRASPADIDAWWERAGVALLRIVTGGASAVATLAVRYIREHATAEGVRGIEPVRLVPPSELLETSLRVMGPVAFKTSLRANGSETTALRVMRGQLAGIAASRTIDGSRDTTMATFEDTEQMVGWRRVARGDACAFCLMLASRGAVYSARTVNFVAHQPRCHCTPEPLWREEPEPADVLALRKLWKDSTAGFKGKDALNAFRRTIAAQRREQQAGQETDSPEA